MFDEQLFRLLIPLGSKVLDHLRFFLCLKRRRKHLRSSDVVDFLLIGKENPPEIRYDFQLKLPWYRYLNNHSFFLLFSVTDISVCQDIRI